MKKKIWTESWPCLFNKGLSKINFIYIQHCNRRIAFLCVFKLQFKKCIRYQCVTYREKRRASTSTKPGQTGNSNYCFLLRTELYVVRIVPKIPCRLSCKYSSSLYFILARYIKIRFEDLQPCSSKVWYIIYGDILSRRMLINYNILLCMCIQRIKHTQKSNELFRKRFLSHL